MGSAVIPVGLMLAVSLAGCSGNPTDVLKSKSASDPNVSFADSTGQIGTTVTTAPPLSLIQQFGTNGRTCTTCHLPFNAWTVTTDNIQQRFNASNGTDRLFQTVDGSNCTNADVSTLDKARSAYSVLLNHGLIRFQMPIPANPEFTIASVSDPYNCPSTPGSLTVYRRILPMTNLGFLSTVMWDGRESTPPSTKTIASNADLQTDLSHQALSAVNSHTQPLTPLTTSQQQTIVNFELGLFTAQSSDSNAGPLDQAGATGSFLPLVNQQFFIGINDPQGQNPSGAPFTPKIFDLFDAWANSSDQAKASIARGQAIFNSRTFSINGATGLGSMTQVSCGTCHNSPNVGTHSVDALMNIGVADPARGLDQSYLAVFTLKNTTTGETLTTTDPGRALITGKWTDIGAFKVPSLRGLAGRPPYFHNGSAASLSDVVTFLDGRFGIGMNAQEKTDLVAFLSAL